MSFTEAEKAERRAEYRRYLKSRTWKAIRGAAIHRAGGVCEWCKGTDIIQVHHIKYPRVFGTEPPETLRVLCDPCHAEQHGQPYLVHKLSREKQVARRERLKKERPQYAKAFRSMRREARAKRKEQRAAGKPMDPVPSNADLLKRLASYKPKPKPKRADRSRFYPRAETQPLKDRFNGRPCA